jgi:two-component system NtrC family sensor kinase
MDQIALQSQRCKRITHNLLRFSRRTRSMIETVDLNRFVAEVVDLMERETRTSGIRLLTDLDPNLPAIQSDPSQLQQVFLNLITNAVDAHEGKPYGSIRISTRYDKDTGGIFLSIADSGNGIDPKYLDRIFDPFFTTKPVGKGTGLGLSICYSIIRQLKGNITVKSEPGEGTEFMIFLPLSLSEKEPRESGPSGPDKTSDPSI